MHAHNMYTHIRTPTHTCINIILQVSAVCAALMDRNVLVQRASLDVVSILFPFHQSFLLLPDLTSILSAALHTLLKRDVSLSRRLYVWLLGSQIQKSSLVISHMKSPSSNGGDSDGEGVNPAPTLDASYFEKYSKTHLISALKGILVKAREASRLGLSKMECVLPYRLLRALVDKPEIGVPVTEAIMPDLVSCLKEQIEGLGGLSTAHSHGSKEAPSSKFRGSGVSDRNTKKSGKKGSLKADIVQSANLLFTTLTQDFVWCWVATMLEKCSAEEESVLTESTGRRAGERTLSLEALGHSTPVSEFLESGSDTRELSHGRSADVEGGCDGDRPLHLNTLLAMLMFLMQVIPKVCHLCSFLSGHQKSALCPSCSLCVD